MIELETIEALAREIGSHVLSQPKPPTFKTMQELFTVFKAFDRPLYERMWQRLHALRPQAASAEELDGRLPEKGEVWVIDALDGAIQYLHDLPDWCVSITLVRDLVPVAAVLHHPILGETYSAQLGRGSTRNGQPIRPSEKTELAAAFMATTQVPFANRFPRESELSGRSLIAMLATVGAVRNFGPTSWQIADVASGRIDGFWLYGVDDVNLMGAALIAREAGAQVTDATGAPWRAGAASFLVSTPTLHGELVSVLAKVS